MMISANFFGSSSGMTSLKTLMRSSFCDVECGGLMTQAWYESPRVYGRASSPASGPFRLNRRRGVPGLCGSRDASERQCSGLPAASARRGSAALGPELSGCNNLSPGNTDGRSAVRSRTPKAVPSCPKAELTAVVPLVKAPTFTHVSLRSAHLSVEGVGDPCARGCADYALSNIRCGPVNRICNVAPGWTRGHCLVDRIGSVR